MSQWDLTQDILVQRYKRFLADTGSGLTLHCPNTGAMTGMQAPGSRIAYRPTEGGKTAGRWILIETETGLACVDSALANQWVKQSIEAWMPDFTWRSEVKLAGKRIDFCGESEQSKFWIEVKGVTLHLGNGQGAFPDAVSQRALEHVQVLLERVEAGEQAALMYVLMHNGIERVRSAQEIHPAYAKAVEAAAQKGLQVWQWPTQLSWLGVQMGSPERLA